MKNPIPGLAKKKKREIWKLANNGKFDLEPQYTSLPHKPRISGCQKKELTTLVLVTKLLLKSWQKQSHAELENKRGSCLLMTTETKQKKKKIKQTDTSLKINFLVICCSASLLIIFFSFLFSYKNSSRAQENMIHNINLSPMTTANIM